MAEEAGRRRRAAVVVLGDIGRSPRMQYHSLSLANQAGMEVDIVANGGSDPHLALRENPSIHIHEMKSVQLLGLSKISGALALLLKAAIQFIMLIWFLCFKIPRPDVFIVQNPPSVPTLAAVKLVSWLRGAKFIVDWHNFGYTLLGLSHGRSHVIVKVYFWFEKHFGLMADGAFCVTKAMQHELVQNWGIKATVLYDHSPEFFHPASLTGKHELFCRLGSSVCGAMGSADCISVEKEVEDKNTTVLTSKIDGGVSLKPNRPALVVSSTSWTPDQDFSILLEAALMYDRRVAATLGEEDSMDEGQLWIDIKNGKQFDYPRLLFIITGSQPEESTGLEMARCYPPWRRSFSLPDSCGVSSWSTGEARVVAAADLRCPQHICCTNLASSGLCRYSRKKIVRQGYRGTMYMEEATNGGVHDASANSALLSNAFPEV